ncbi:MAG: ParB/RepB/Spo0J family partition protein [Planctomycetota bacterium]|nr:ParB/RepB/Spo0J family partition protein [Planctomycetota bacterium]
MERRLGRGLGSLLGTSTPIESRNASEVISLASLRPNPHQPRKHFDPSALSELTESIRRHGILQPIVVRPSSDGYEIVSGERRFRASQAAGLTTIPATVRRDVTDDQMLELALVENLQRQDLDAMERAAGYAQMMSALSLTQEQVAERVGLKRSTVANHLRLLDLQPAAQDAVRKGLISMGHARALLAVPDKKHQLQLVDRIARDDLSVRQVELLARGMAPNRNDPGAILPPYIPNPPWMVELEGRIRDHLGTKVQIRNNPGVKGEIVVQYFNASDLDRLAKLLAPREEIR